MLDLLGHDPFTGCSSLLSYSNRELQKFHDDEGYISPLAKDDPEFDYLDRFYQTIRTVVLCSFDEDDFQQSYMGDFDDLELGLAICYAVNHWHHVMSARYDILALTGYDFARDELTALCIELSLCPLHRIDWAICFDDQDPECDQIRAIYPNSHDT